MNERVKGDNEGIATYIDIRGSSVLDIIIVKEDEIGLPIKTVNMLEIGKSGHLPNICKIRQEEAVSKEQEEKVIAR